MYIYIYMHRMAMNLVTFFDVTLFHEEVFDKTLAKRVVSDISFLTGIQ